MRLRPLAVALAALMLSAAPAFAHGLLMKLAGDGPTIVGELYYSNGRKAAGEWIEVVDLADPQGPPITRQTGEDGGFRVPGGAGRTYRVTASGEEGHTVAMELALTPKAKPQLADEAAKAQATKPPPAWMLIGGLLLLSIIPALWLQRRSPKG